MSQNVFCKRIYENMLLDAINFKSLYDCTFVASIMFSLSCWEDPRKVSSYFLNFKNCDRLCHIFFSLILYTYFKKIKKTRFQKICLMQ